MPLWGKKLYQPRTNEKRKVHKSPKFLISFTDEVFDSQKEYKEQIALYQQPLWTCQCTSRSGLTYEEANASEVRHKRKLMEQIPMALQKAILQMVHHSSESLDSLVERIVDQYSNQFYIGEMVELSKTKGKIIKGKILQIQTCNGSPSSDKENHSVEHDLISKSNKNTPLYYNIQIGGKNGKVISSVPASDLIRCLDLPSSDLIAMLIRSNALQAGVKPSSPWVVSPDLVLAMDIRNKLIETLLPSTRISIRGLKGAANRKRKPSNQSTQPSKKMKLRNGAAAVNGERTPTKNDLSPVVIVDMDSEDYREVSHSPSPEKVFLDHSYSSPKSKSGSATSPRETAKSPLDHSYSSSQSKTSSTEKVRNDSSTSKKKLATKQSLLKAMGSFKKVKSADLSAKGLKKAKEQKVKVVANKKSPKKKKKFEKDVIIVNDSSESSESSDSSSSSDSDIVLIELSPKKKAKSTPVRRTLADHFLAMSNKKASRERKADEERKGGSRVNGGSGIVKLSKEVVKKTEKRRESDKDQGSAAKKSEKVDGKTSQERKKNPIKETSKNKARVLIKKRKTEQSLQKDAKRIASKVVMNSENKSPLKSSPKKVLTTPKKSPLKSLKKSTSQSPLKSPKMSPKKKVGTSPTKTPSKSPGKGKSPLKSRKVSPKKSMMGNKASVKPKLKSSKSKNLKQATLFSFSAKKKVLPDYTSSDEDALILYKVARPILPVTPREPPIAVKMMKAKRLNNKSLYNRLLGQAAKMLTKKQIQALKPLIQGDVMARAQAFEARLKWQKLTPEERQAILEAKRGERKKKQAEERKIRQDEEKEKAKRYEDQLLDLPPLIVPKPVPLPEGLPNTLFGDIAMVVEFINSFSGFLMPNDPYPVTADSFMKALVCGKDGFAYLSRVLVILLKTLLQDQITEDFLELGMKLSDIPVNMHTASELLRLSLLQTDTDVDRRNNDDDSDTSSVNQEEGEFTAPQELVELLETSEFYSLSPEVKLELIVCVCNRILTTYSLVDYMEDKQKKATRLWCQKMKTLKLKNDQQREEKKKLRAEREAAQMQKKEEKERMKAEKEKETKTEDKKPAKKPAKKKVKKEEPKKETPAAPEEEPEDLASVVKRRRILAARAKQEQEELAIKDQERRIRLEEERKMQKEKQSFEKDFAEGIRMAKLVLRQQPIGTDRNHNRYWVFSSVTPGLFVEKGWVNQGYDYNIATSMEEGMECWTTPIKAENSRKQNGVEKSIPKVGQNLWFQYDTMKELDALLVCLDNTGIRESTLCLELKKRYNDISKLIFQCRRSGPELRDSNGPKELLDSYKEDLKDIENHVRQGNLGGVANFEKWEKKLDATSSLKDLGILMLESQASVNSKFLESMMTPSKVKEREENDDEYDKVEECKLTEKLLKWNDAVKNAVTMSRLHVLLSIFEVCVKWEKSLENAKCKICRKKGDAEHILLCDKCNTPFHLFCIRPALSSHPANEWQCPSCAPLQQRVCRQKRSYKDETTSEGESEDEVSESDEDNYDYEDDEAECCVCGMQEETISCSQCDSAYHKDCHEPPMRNFPRGKWSCYSCLHGRTNRRGKAKYKRRQPRR